MGILNVTPDSFSDGRKFFDTRRAVAHAMEMVRDGADIIDVGGESTRPGALPVDADTETDRVVPVIEKIVRLTRVPVSVDTRKSAVARRAVRAGARIINDVSGLHHDARIADVAARSGAGLILMHMKGTPADMQRAPRYRDLVGEIRKSLAGSIARARRAGVPKRKILIDPGIGFGKSFDDNLTILHRLDDFLSLGCPLCIGVSRKAFIGRVLGLEVPAERVDGSVAAQAIAVMSGARIIRSHDVRQAVASARVADAVRNESVG